MGGAVASYIYDTSMEDPLAFDDITLEFDSTASPILKRRWMHSDAVDEPVGFEAYTASSGVGSGTEHTMFADRQGSVIWVTEPATGLVVAGYEYDGYGQITQTTGTQSQPYGYTGREYDAESGLYHYRARAYDPAAGVFVQVDPIEFESEQFNIYTYGAASPFYLRDPEGTNTEKVVLTAGGAMVAGNAGAQIGSATISAAGRLAARIAFAGVLASVSQNEEESKDECDRALERALDSIKHAFNGCMLTAGFAPTWKYRQKLVKQCEVDRRISTSNAKKDWEACYKEAIDERRRGN